MRTVFSQITFTLLTLQPSSCLNVCSHSNVPFNVISFNIKGKNGRGCIKDIPNLIIFAFPDNDKLLFVENDSRLSTIMSTNGADSFLDCSQSSIFP